MVVRNPLPTMIILELSLHVFISFYFQKVNINTKNVSFFLQEFSQKSFIQVGPSQICLRHMIRKIPRNT